MSGEEPLSHESVFRDTELSIYNNVPNLPPKCWLEHFSRRGCYISFLYTILSRFPRFLFKKSKSDRVVFAIGVVVFLTFVVSFSLPCLGQRFLIEAYVARKLDELQLTVKFIFGHEHG